MSGCDHRELVRVGVPSDKLRCQRCHLTILASELGGGHCPECFEESGERRYEFAEFVDPAARRCSYRCEICGTLIAAD